MLITIFRTESHKQTDEIKYNNVKYWCLYIPLKRQFDIVELPRLHSVLINDCGVWSFF